MSRFIILFARCVAAIAVMGVISFVALVIVLPVAFAFLPDKFDAWHFYFCFFVGMGLASFCGVFVGTLCLERASRRFGSILLFFLGLASYVCFIFSSDFTDHIYPLRSLIPLAIGGLLAVVLTFLMFRRQQPNTARGCVKTPARRE